MFADFSHKRLSSPQKQKRFTFILCHFLFPQPEFPVCLKRNNLYISSPFAQYPAHPRIEQFGTIPLAQ